MTSATEVQWLIKYKHKETNNRNVKKKKSQRVLHSTCSLFQTGETVHLFPALSLTSLTLRHKLGHHVNPRFNNIVAKQFDKPCPSHKYLSRTENLKINTDVIHLLSTVIQAPMQKIHKAVGELLGNANTVEEVTQHELLKKMAQSSALFCKEPTSILTPHLLLTLCSTMCLLAFGQTV